MTALLLRFKWHLVAALTSSLAVGYLTYSVCSWVYNNRIDDMEVQCNLDIISAKAEERKVCAANQAITKEVYHELQDKNKAIDDKHNTIVNRLRDKGANGSCVPITSASRSNDAAAKRDVLSVQGGVVADTLADTAKQCDKQTAQLIACQKFVAVTWQTHQLR